MLFRTCAVCLIAWLLAPGPLQAPRPFASVGAAARHAPPASRLLHRAKFMDVAGCTLVRSPMCSRRVDDRRLTSATFANSPRVSPLRI